MEFRRVLIRYVPETAQKGLESTGKKKYIETWTELSGTIVSCSTGIDKKNMPVGILLCAHPKSDFFLSNFCKQIANKSSFFAGLNT